MTRTWNRYGTAMGVSLLMVLSMLLPVAEASHCWTDDHGRQHCDQGRHKGWISRRNMSPQTRQILRGSLIGAGIGAGAGVLLGRSLLTPTLLGAGIGGGLGALSDRD